MMKRFFLIFFLLLSVAGVSKAQDTYFPYPQPPDTIQSIENRTAYFIQHFWDRCNFKNAFSSKARLGDAFKDYIQIIGTSTDSIVFPAVDNFMHSLDKLPEQQAFFVEQAEKELYSDSAQFFNDKLYIAFANPMLQNKKVKKEFKLRPQRLVDILSGSAVGARVPLLEYTDRDGKKGSTKDDIAQLVVYFFNDPDCDDCLMTRMQLYTDIKASQMIRDGVLKVVSIYPGEYSEEWAAKVKSYPEEWRVVAAPDAEDVYDLRMLPTFYIMNGNKIRIKGANIQQVLNVINVL